MTTYERRQSLLDTLRKQPGLRVPELARALDVSEGTVRNDLNALEQQGVLVRVHGGAVLNQQDQFQNTSFVRRYQQNAAAKFAIAREAAVLVNDGDFNFAGCQQHGLLSGEGIVRTATLAGDDEWF